MTDLTAELAAVLPEPPVAVAPLSGGCIGAVCRVELTDGRRLVAKVDPGPQPRLDTEGYMLRYLAAHSALPVPQVVHAAPRLLLMTWLTGSSRFSPAAERAAAELLLALHAVTAPTYGLERDTLIGGLLQENRPNPRWLPFFRDQRLLAMGRQARDAGRLPARTYDRLERLAARLDRWLAEPARPSLVHGDVWITNVLAQGDRITGFLDPAVYYADREIELAFITLFDTFGAPFFDRYRAAHPLDDAFFAERRHLYNLFPLLVHVRLFGGGYVGSVERTLARFGC